MEPTRPGSLLPPHFTALPGSEDIGAAPPPVHRESTMCTPIPARLQTEALHHAPLRSSSVLPISARVVPGFNQRKPPSRTITIAVDISKAYDTVSHRLLIEMIHRSRLRHILVRWIVHASSAGRPRASISSTTRLPARCGHGSHRDPSSSQPSSTTLCRTTQFPI